MENKYNERSTIYGHYQQNVRQKVGHIDSTTNAFEVMITNANMGSLSQTECNKILENLIKSIEDMETENRRYHQQLERKKKRSQPIQDLLEYDPEDEEDSVNNAEEIEEKGVDQLRGKDINKVTEKEMDEEILLNQIESRVLKALREKALLQRSSNELIRNYELKEKVRFFKKKQPKT